MSRPIFDPEYWRVRIVEAGPALRNAVYPINEGAWEEIEDSWRTVLAREVAADTAVLDVGCGYGRLLNLMPAHWGGYYVGADLSPEFIAHAKTLHPGYASQFIVRDFRDRQYALEGGFDLAVFGLVREMVREFAPDDWPAIEENVRRCAKSMLFLELDGARE